MFNRHPNKPNKLTVVTDTDDVFIEGPTHSTLEIPTNPTSFSNQGESTSKWHPSLNSIEEVEIEPEIDFPKVATNTKFYFHLFENTPPKAIHWKPELDTIKEDEEYEYEHKIDFSPQNVK